MLRIYSILASAALILMLFTPPVLAPIKTDQLSNASCNDIFEDIIADYALYASLLYDVYPVDQYRVSLHANNPDAASAYLRGGFTPALAADIAGYYLQWLPDIEKMAVIPTDSIPIITEADKLYLSIEWISPDKILIYRTYNDCYEPGDRFLYRIIAQAQEDNWIIEDLQLDRL